MPWVPQTTGCPSEALPASHSKVDNSVGWGRASLPLQWLWVAQLCPHLSGFSRELAAFSPSGSETWN